MQQDARNLYYFRKDHFQPVGNYRTSEVHEVTLHTFHSVTSKPIQIRRTSRKQIQCQNAAEELWTARCATALATDSPTSHLPSMTLSPANALSATRRSLDMQPCPMPLTAPWGHSPALAMLHSSLQIPTRLPK
jgi:hypothetical protein